MWTTSRAPPAVITAVAFGTMSPDDVRKLSQREVTGTILVRRKEPSIDGPNSPFFGTEDRNLRCITCSGEPASGKFACEGHFGHIELALPCAKPDWIHISYLVRKCICYYCSRELFDRNSAQMKHIRRTLKGYVRLQAIAVAMENKTKLCCGQPNTTFRFEDVVKKGLPCGSRQPKWKHVGMRILPDFEGVPAQAHTGARPAFTSKVDWQGQVQISKRTARFMGFNTRLTHPSNLILTVLPVPPICIRPSTDIHQHDFTTQLTTISKLNVALKSVLKAVQRWHAIRGPLSDQEKQQQRVDTERFYNTAIVKYQMLTGTAANGTTGQGTGSTGGPAPASQYQQQQQGTQRLQHAKAGGGGGKGGGGGGGGAYNRRASSLHGLRLALTVIECTLDQAQEYKDMMQLEQQQQQQQSTSKAEAKALPAGSLGGGPWDDPTGTLKKVGQVLAEYSAEVHMELQYAVWTYFDNSGRCQTLASAVLWWLICLLLLLLLQFRVSGPMCKRRAVVSRTAF